MGVPGGSASEAAWGVKVVVRIRPLVGSEREGTAGDGTTQGTPMHPRGGKVYVTRSSGAEGAEAVLTPAFDPAGDRSRRFPFDVVVGPEEEAGRAEEAVFEACRSVVEGAVRGGLNGTVLAYGQTGSGKTHAMGGWELRGARGLVPRAAGHLFGEIRAVEAEGDVHVRATATFVELHGETLRDLLVSEEAWVAQAGEPGERGIGMREGRDGVSLVGAVEEPVGCVEDVAAVWARGVKRRAVGATGMNAASSRSHAVLCVTVRVEPAGGSTAGQGKVAKLQLVDLAGSERVTRTGLEGDQLKEGIGINKGLLCLGNVIQALSTRAPARDGSSASGTAPTPVHVPYRESKLTRLLRDSWGGNSQTVMVACVSPAERDVDDSMSTLRYASRARKITNRVRTNSTGSIPPVPTAAMYEELERLRSLVEVLQSNAAAAAAAAAAADRLAQAALERAPAPEPEPESSAEAREKSAQTDVAEFGRGRNAAHAQVDRAAQVMTLPEWETAGRHSRRSIPFWLVFGVAAGASLGGGYLPGPLPPPREEVGEKAAGALAVEPACPPPLPAVHLDCPAFVAEGGPASVAPIGRPTSQQTLPWGAGPLLAAYGAASLARSAVVGWPSRATPVPADARAYDARAFFT